MPLETFGFITSLNASNPPASDGQSQGDDHLRGIKSTLLSTFPNLSAAVTATAAQLNQLASGFLQFAAGNSTAPSISFLSFPTLGFYRPSAGEVTFVGGRLSGNGLCPTGMIADFIQVAIPEGWYELNGQAVPRTGVTAALFAHYGTNYGVGDGSTTFNLPNLTDRFRRSRGTWGVGVQLADAIKSHTASVSTAGGVHSHGVTQSPHDHGVAGGTRYVGTASNLADSALGGSNYQYATGATALDIDTAIANITINNSDSLTMTGTATYSGDTETRPLSVVVVTCVKA